MRRELEISHANGKGIYAMKILGGGRLISDVEQTVNYIRNLDFICSMAIGVKI